MIISSGVRSQGHPITIRTVAVYGSIPLSGCRCTVIVRGTYFIEKNLLREVIFGILSEEKKQKYAAK